MQRAIGALGDIGVESAQCVDPAALEEHPRPKDVAQGLLEGLGAIDEGQQPLTVQRKAPVLNRGS